MNNETLTTSHELDNETKSVVKSNSSKPQTVLIDDVETNPAHDFVSLSRTIANIIKNSSPHFTIGIYGEWGMGKTTLMKAIEEKLKEETVDEKEKKIIPVWFNAWRYEREENLATIALMKTIAYALADHKKFDIVSKTILKGLEMLGKDLMQQIALQVIAKKKSEELDEQFSDKMEFLNKLVRDSVYFDGLQEIKQQMTRIREREEDKDYRVVVFIDDLDRCTSKKALEVLESIKVFLDMEGFVYVIGLNLKTVTQLITHAYKTTGVKGEDYIKKIIQIPIRIPRWSDDDIIDLIENKIAPRINEDYAKFLRQNSHIMAKIVDSNPRQVKRFINNVIIAFETFANKESVTRIELDEIFLLQILKTEWNDFYVEFSKNQDFRNFVQWVINMKKELGKFFKYLRNPTNDDPVEQKNTRLKLLAEFSSRTGDHVNSHQIEILSEFDYDTWTFLEKYQDILYRIENWKAIDRATEVVEDIPYALNIESGKPKDQEIKENSDQST